MQRTREPRFLLTSHLTAFVLFVLLVASEFCSPHFDAQAAIAIAPSPTRQQTSPLDGGPGGSYIETALGSLTGYAEDIFNLALAGNLERAEKRLDSLKKQAVALDCIQDEANLTLLPRLKRTIADLGKAISAKNVQETLRKANRVTLIAAALAVPYKPRIPTEVSLLEYNGREIEIWSAVKRVDKLSGITLRMHLAWQTLMPKLIQYNGDKELKRFSELMRRLEQARTAEEYDRVSKQILAGTETLEAIFAKPITESGHHKVPHP